MGEGAGEDNIQSDEPESCSSETGSFWDGTTRYRVTDLVVHSAGDLTAVATAFEENGLRVTQRALKIADEALEWFRISASEWMWIFQAGMCGPCDGPELELSAFLTAIEALAPPERAVWDACSMREFDLAYDCGVRPIAIRNDLSAGTLARLTAAGGSIRITLYALDPSEVRPEDPRPSQDGGA